LGPGAVMSHERHCTPSLTVFWWHSQSPRETFLDAAAMTSWQGLMRPMQSPGKLAGFLHSEAATMKPRIAAQPSFTTAPQAVASGAPSASHAATKGSRYAEQ